MHHPRIFVAVAFVAAALTGCKSLSIDQELEQAGQRIHPRVGFTPEWSEDWTEYNVTADLVRPLTVEEAVRVAVHNHSSIRARLAYLAERRADLVQAGLLPNPVVTLAFGIPMDDGGGQPQMHGLMQDVAALWKRPSRIAAADAELRAALLELCDAVVEIAASVKRGMAELHHAQRRHALSSREAELLGERARLIQERESAGESTRLQVYAAQADMGAARLREIDDRARIGVARRVLLERLGVSARTLDAASYDFSTLPPAGDPVPTEHEVIRLIASHRLDVVAAFAIADASESRRVLAAHGRWPDVKLGAAYNRNFEDRDGLGPAAAVSVPVFDTGRTGVARARAARDRNLAEARRQLGDAVAEARIAHVKLTEASERRASLENDLVAPRRDEEQVAREVYLAGEGTRTSVLEREAARLEAERRLEDAVLQTRLARHDLWRAVGGSFEPLDEDEEVEP